MNIFPNDPEWMRLDDLSTIIFAIRKSLSFLVFDDSESPNATSYECLLIVVCEMLKYVEFNVDKIVKELLGRCS